MSTPAFASAAPPVQAVEFKNILFATDFSEPSMRALPYATGLARKFGANLILCHVLTPTPLAVGAPEAAPYLYQAELESSTRALDDLLHAPPLHDIKSKSIMPAGILSEELKAAIEDNKVDLVIAGTHGRTGVRRLLLGSSAEEICRVAECPVLTVGPDLAPRGSVEIKSIVMPSDLSEESGFAVPCVAALARAYGAQVTVLHVMPEDAATNPDAEKLAEPVRKTMLHKFEAEFAELKPVFVIEFGEAVETILEVARKKNADLIAMGIRNAFLPGFQLRSSVAYRLMTAAHCPVLTCR
jgi:nucleotide-binding universal stress UspA family protein